jgi:hypothetical protein
MCLIACALLIVLWVRSYYQTDSVYLLRTNSYHNVRSVYGKLTILKLIQLSPRNNWGISSKPASDFKEMPDAWPFDTLPPQHSGLGFASLNSPKVKIFAMPYWFLVLLSATLGTLAVAPWLKWRFSLRTMLIATAVIAILLGLIVIFSG